MSPDLFSYLTKQLGDMGYSDWLGLFSNNEPLLNPHITDVIQEARSNIPGAKLKLFTNGTLLTRSKFADLLHLLDHLYLDNYNMNSEYNKATIMALDYIDQHPELSEKLTIFVTRPDAKRGSRAGLVKNRIFQKLYSPCFLPFHQFIVRPDGKTGLCCNDAIGSTTLADLTKETIPEAWNNKNYCETREIMKLHGRSRIPRCQYCDTMTNGSELITKIRRALGGND
jgi:hypothetical protein